MEEGGRAHVSWHSAVAALLEACIYSARADRDDHRATLALHPCPCLLLLTLLQHPPLPLAPIIPAKNLPKLAH